MGPDRWLGTHERALTGSGLMLMGARLYNPSTGLFSSTDPIYGGNVTTYGYPNDPVNSSDMSGESLNPYPDIGGRGRPQNTYARAATAFKKAREFIRNGNDVFRMGNQHKDRSGNWRASIGPDRKHWVRLTNPWKKQAYRIHLEIQLSKSMVKTGAEFHGNSRTYGRWKTFSNKFSDFWSRDFSPRGGGGTGVRKP